MQIYSNENLPIIIDTNCPSVNFKSQYEKSVEKEKGQIKEFTTIVASDCPAVCLSVCGSEKNLNGTIIVAG